MQSIRLKHGLSGHDVKCVSCRKIYVEHALFNLMCRICVGNESVKGLPDVGDKGHMPIEFFILVNVKNIKE